MEIYAHCTVPCLYVIVNRRVTKEAFGWAKERGNCSIVYGISTLIELLLAFLVFAHPPLGFVW